MIPDLGGVDVASLRACVSAGETLPKATWEAVHEASGIRLIDGIGSTEMLHIFISRPATRSGPEHRTSGPRLRGRGPGR